MHTENTSLKNTIPAGESNTNTEMVIGKINTYQRTFLIVAGSLLALLVLVAVAGINGDHHLQLSAHKIAEGVVSLVDFQVDSANLAFTKDISNGFKLSEEGNDNSNGKKSRKLKQKRNKKSKNKKKDKKTTPETSGLLSVSENDEGINLGGPYDAISYCVSNKTCEYDSCFQTYDDYPCLIDGFCKCCGDKMCYLPDASSSEFKAMYRCDNGYFLYNYFDGPPDGCCGPPYGLSSGCDSF